MNVTQFDPDDGALPETPPVSGHPITKDAGNSAPRDDATSLRRAAEFDGYLDRSRGWDYAQWQSRRAEDKKAGAL